MKKLLAIVLSVIMVFSAVLVNVFATDSVSDACGENLTSTFDEETGELVISGTGEMWDFARDYDSVQQTTVFPDQTTFGSDYHENNIRPWSGIKRKIKKITIEDGVTSIGDYAFEDCFSLESITVPDSLTSIGDCAFRHSSLQNISTLKNIAEIGEEAFWGCDLTNIYIPKSTTHIGRNAFNYMWTTLENISVDTDNPAYSSDENGNLFNKDKTKLIKYTSANTTGYTIPDSVTSIGKDSFYHDSTITNVIIGDNVTDIEEKAFSMCWNLSNVSIGKNVRDIGIGAFSRCKFKHIILPNGIENIRYAAFYNTPLREVYYRGTQEEWNSIPIEANNDELTLAKIHFIPENSPEGSCGENLTWFFVEETGELFILGTGAMDNYSADSPAPWDELRADIKKITVTDGVTTIGNDTFTGCENLTEVSLPDGLTKIGDSAFRDCVSLDEIEIPDSVKSLGHYAFYGCTGFEEFWLGSGVKTIGNHAFRKCANLRIITLPETLSTVNKNAFNGCDALDFVIFEGTKEQWDAVTIGDGNEPLTSAMFRCGEIIKGDADGDGQVNSTDALWCLQHSVGKIQFVGDWADAIDINGDGKVNSYDALKILQFSVGNIE